MKDSFNPYENEKILNGMKPLEDRNEKEFQDFIIDFNERLFNSVNGLTDELAKEYAERQGFYEMKKRVLNSLDAALINRGLKTIPDGVGVVRGKEMGEIADYDLELIAAAMDDEENGRK